MATLSEHIIQRTSPRLTYSQDAMKSLHDVHSHIAHGLTWKLRGCLKTSEKTLNYQLKRDPVFVQEILCNFYSCLNSTLKSVSLKESLVHSMHTARVLSPPLILKMG